MFGIKKKPIKLCVDCKWYEKDTAEGFDKCFSPILYPPRVSLVRGTKSREYGFCDIGRKYSCDKSAKYFKPKEVEKCEIQK